MQRLMIYATYMQWVDAGIDDVCYVHAAECYSDLKRKCILTHAARWMNLMDMMLNETIQTLVESTY